MLIVNLLGEFGVTLNGQPLTLQRRIGRMLAYLLLNPRHHNRELLTSVFWPEDDKPHLSDLRGNVTRLRKVLGEDGEHQLRVVGTDGLRFYLQPGDFVDVLALEQTQLADADLATLLKLVHSYAPPADDVADLFPLVRLEKLVERYGQVLAALCARLQEQGDARQALPWVKKWIEHEPQSEAPYIQQMQLFAALGDEDGVLNSFELCERNKEMPASRKMREAHDRCIAHAQRVAAQGVLPAHNLPHYDTALVGRSAELARITTALRGGGATPGSPLLSLIGLGGMGKTRLAVEAARQVLRSFADGVFFVKLDATRDVNGLAAHIADALGFRFYAGESSEQQLHNRLRDKQVLLVLDGFEHVLGSEENEAGDASAASDAGDAVAWLDRLVDAAEGLKLMITSRQRLLSPHEQVLDLAGLAVPVDADDPDAAKSEALDLFQRLARRRYSDDLPLADMLNICKLVQGMPLGIELAASWVRAKSCAEIAAGIARERDLAAADDTQVTARPISLRATFEFSWKQLNAAERELFMKLCLFEAGCTSAAAEAVAEATGSGLMALADKSFIRREPNGRYVIHDLLREFGREKFGEAGLAERRGVAEKRIVTYFAEFAQAQQHTGLAGYDVLESERINLLTTVRLAHTHQDWESILQLAQALTDFWYWRSRYADALVGHRLAAEAATALNRRPMLLRSLRWQGRMLLEQGQYNEAESLYTRALEIAFDEEDEVEIAWVKYDQALVRVEKGHIEEASLIVSESFSILEEYGHEEELPEVLILIARCCLQRGDADNAAKAARRSRNILEKKGPSAKLVYAYKWLSETAQYQKDWKRAQSYCESANEISRVVKDEFAMASCQYSLAALFYRSGNEYSKGLELAESARKSFIHLGVRKSAIYCMALVGMLHARLGDLHKAKNMMTTSLNEVQLMNDTFASINYEMYLGDVLDELGDSNLACKHWQQAHTHAKDQSHPLQTELKHRLSKCS